MGIGEPRQHSETAEVELPRIGRRAPQRFGARTDVDDAPVDHEHGLGARRLGGSRVDVGVMKDERSGRQGRSRGQGEQRDSYPQ